MNVGDTQQIFSQCTYTNNVYGYVWTVLSPPSGSDYKDTGFMPPTTSIGGHYTTVTFDQVGTWTLRQWSQQGQNGTAVSNQTNYITVGSPPPPPTYTLTTSTTGTGTGTLTPSGGTYNAGSTVNITATATSGDEVKSYTVNGTTTQLSKPYPQTYSLPAITMNGDTTMQVEFWNPQIDVTFTVSGRTQTYDGSAKGVKVSANADPDNTTYTVSYDGGAFGPYSYTGLSDGTQGPVKAGTYSVSVDGTGVYHGSATDTLIINPVSATVTLGGLAQTYDGSPKTASATTSPSGLGVSFTYNGSSTAPVDAGNYTVLGTVDDPNYQGSSTGTMTIGKASATLMLGNLAQTWDGTQKSPSVTTSPPGLKVDLLYTGAGYGPTGSAPSDVGSYIVAGTVNDADYQGSSTTNMIIERVPVTFFLSNLTQTYDGSPKSASVSPSDPSASYTVTYAGTGGAGYGPSASAPTDIGQYTVNVSATGNYQGSATETLTIEGSANVTASISASPNSTTEPGSATVTWSTANAASVSVSGSSGSGFSASSAPSGSATVTGLAAGTYTYTITAQGNGGPVTQSATVTVLAVTASISANPTSATAPGASTITWSSANATSVSVSGPGMTTSTAANGSATVTGLMEGTYTYTITADGNSPVTKTATVTVAANTNVTASISANPTSATAPGASTITWSSANATSVSASGPGMTTSTAPSGSATVTGLAAGTYTYVITAQGNGGPVTRSATVTVAGNTVTASIGATVTSANSPGAATITWSSANATSISVWGANMPPSIAASGSTPVTGLAAGTYTYTITANGSGGPVTRTATVTIGGGHAAVTICVNPAIVTAPGSTTVTWNTTGVRTGSVFVSGPGVHSTAANGSQTTGSLGVGRYNWTIRAQDVFGQYINNSAFLIVNASTVPVTASIGANPTSITYPGTTTISWTSANATSVSVAGANMPASKAPGGNYTVSGLYVGEWYGYTITAQGYQGPVIHAAYVTVAQGTPTVTWNTPAPINYGTPLYSAQLNGTANIPGTFAYTPAAGTVLGAGTHALGATFFPQDGRDWTTATANTTIVVNPVQLVVTADHQSRVYGATNPALTVTYRGFVSRDSAASLTTDPSATTTATTSSAVGSYPISVGGGVSSNYTFTYRSGTLVITPEPVSFTFSGDGAQPYSGASKVVTASAGDPNATFTLAYSGTGGTSYGPTTTAPTAAGEYAVTATATGNYTGSATAALTIMQASASVTLGGLSQTYDGTAKNATAATSPAGLGVSFTYDGSSTAPTNAGTCTVVGTISDPNYQGSSTGTMTIGKGAATVALGNLSQTYDGAAKPATATTNPGGLAVALTYDGGPSAPNAAGSHTVSATINDPNYQGSATGTLTIAKAEPTLTWAPPSAITYGAALGETQLNATASVPGSFAYSPAAGTVLDAGSRTLSVGFTPADSTDYRTETMFVPIVVSPAPRTISLNPSSTGVFVGEPVTFTASGGGNSYVWGGDAGAVGSIGSVTLTFPSVGTYALTVFSPAGGNYLQSNTASSSITVTSNHLIASFTPVASSYTVTDPASPMHNQTYGRIWQEGGGWTAYLGRSGVKFEVKGQAYPSVKAISIEAKEPGKSNWIQFATQVPGGLPTSVDATFDTMLDSQSAGNPLQPASYGTSAPLTGNWTFRARLQDSNGGWSAYSPEVQVKAVFPIKTKTVSGQTVPPSGPLGDWFTASPIQNYTFQLWVP